MKRLSPLLLPVIVSLVAACASEPAPRYAVQADVIAKSDLDGIWYFRQTVIGVPYTTGFTFIGEQGDNELEKIRWDIQEDILTARRSYEFVRGTEIGEPSYNTPAGYYGAPVAAFKIKSHFDIIRDYNASTGEEYNKIVENTERKWYERKFMHVDWSVNLVTNFQFLADFDHATVSAIKQDPASYFVSDPNDPDAMRIERPDLISPANYIEITQKTVASPESVDVDGLANYPLCMLEYATADCASQELKIRNSFLRVIPRDYEPLNYDDHMMERFGFFTTDRFFYNRQYGQTDTGHLRLINRFNIWQHNLTATNCQMDSDCGAATSGVHCNKSIPDALVDATGRLTGRCSLPYASRNLQDPTNPSSTDLGPRKIVYYVNDSFPATMVDAAKQMADEYDQTFRATYKSLVGSDSPSSMFVLCTNNPVLAGDPPECGPAGTRPRIGDLRYNMIYWIDEPQTVRLLGYGPSSHDPETGETISATAFIYGAMHERLAANARDIVRLVNGDLPADQFVQGVNVQSWLNTNPQGPHAHPFSQAEVDQMAAAMDFSWAAALPRTPSISPAPARQMMEMTRARSAALSQTQLLGGTPGLAASRLARLKGTDIERQLMTGELLLARGMDPRSSSTPDPAVVQPLALLNPETSRFMKRQRRRLGSHGVDLATTTFDDAVLGLAMQQKGQDPQVLWHKLLVEVFRSTVEHETGHTLGLRHNFAGSFDAMNFPKTYWDLRTANGTHTPQPRYIDPETPAELTGVLTPSGLQAGISEFQTSSIMDYGSRFNTDINGIGPYDRAALKFGYGQLLEVFNDTKDTYLLGALQSTITFGMPQPLTLDCSGNNYVSVHYSSLPQIVDLNNRSDVPFSQITNSIIRPDCAFPDAVDHDAANHLVVPYRFCSDEFESAGIDCTANDRGADVFEVAENAIDSYRNYYLFNNFKRDRYAFNPDDGYLDRIHERYLDPLRTQMQFYVLFRGDWLDTIPDDGTATNFWHSATGWGPFTVAVTEGFNLLGEILTAPAPGKYYLHTQPDGKPAYQQDDNGTGAPAFTLTVPQGRFFSTEWDQNSGYFWYEKIAHIGVFLDKVAAIGQLADPETNFIGADQASDVRQFSINYYRIFPKQITDFFGGMMTDRWDRYAPVWDPAKMAFVRRPISQPLVIPSNGSIAMDPQVGFSVQLQASALGMALIPATYDQSFVDTSRIFLQGNGQQITTSMPTVTYTDPYSGRIYVAISYKDGVIETGLAARMIEHANQLLVPANAGVAGADVTLKSYVQVIEVLRSLNVAYADATH